MVLLRLEERISFLENFWRLKSRVCCLRKSMYWQITVQCLCKHYFNFWICLFLVLLIQIICGLFCRACMATMGILYYRLVQRGLGEEELADDLQQWYTGLCVRVWDLYRRWCIFHLMSRPVDSLLLLLLLLLHVFLLVLPFCGSIVSSHRNKHTSGTVGNFRCVRERWNVGYNPSQSFYCCFFFIHLKLKWCIRSKRKKCYVFFFFFCNYFIMWITLQHNGHQTIQWVLCIF